MPVKLIDGGHDARAPLCGGAVAILWSIAPEPPCDGIDLSGEIVVR